MECDLNNAFEFWSPKNIEAVTKAPPQVKSDLTVPWHDRAMAYMSQKGAAQSAQATAMIARDRQAQNDLHAQLMNNQKAQYDAGVQRNQAQTDAMHQSMQATANHVGDVNDYRDPATGKSYKVSNQYAHTYVDSTGKTIVQTNSSYAPGPDTVWQEMQPR